jgi:predicted membrane protein
VEEHPRAPLTPQLVIGLVAIVAGVVLTLDNLNLANAHFWFRLWPIALMGIGLALSLDAPRGPHQFLGGILFLVGAFLLVNNLVFHLRFRQFWPLIYVVIGLILLRRGLRGRWSGTPLDGSTIAMFSVLGGSKRSSASQSFRGGEATAFLGGCEIDLRQASIDGQATLDVLAFWGGIEIHVPEDWTVISEGVPILGGFDDQTRAPRNGATKRLVIKGFAIMGGVEIRN